MMQTQKQKVTQDILDVAKTEFIKHGFKNASMRTISKNSGVGLSNIYNYFKDKNEILEEVLKPFLQALDKASAEHNNPEYISLNIFTSTEYQQYQINMFVELILKYKEEINLLLFKVSGSSLEDFIEIFTETRTDIGVDYLRKMKRKFPHVNINISRFFIHTMSSWWIDIIGEIVSHNLDAKEIEKFITEYMEFGTAGWEKILKVNFF